MLPLSKYTLFRLEVLLKSRSTPARIKQLLNNAEKLSKEQNTNNITEILDYVFHHPSEREKSMPKWLYDFSVMKNTSVKEKHKFINQYGTLITCKHLMANFDDKNLGEKVVNSYYQEWNNKYAGYFRRMPDFEKNIVSISVGNKHVSPSQLQKEYEEIFNRFTYLRKQYNGILQTKNKPPEWFINIIPTATGHPPVMKRVYNQMLRRLRKFQDYIQKHPPVSHEDMEELNKIDLLELDGIAREAYVKFLSEIFTIDENGKITKSRLLDNRLAKSGTIERLYKEVSFKKRVSNA